MMGYSRSWNAAWPLLLCAGTVGVTLVCGRIK
jgi:hypothetical protein